MSNPRTYNTREVAQMLGVATNTITNWACSGKIKGNRQGKFWTFTREQIADYVKCDQIVIRNNRIIYPKTQKQTEPKDETITSISLFGAEGVKQEVQKVIDQFLAKQADLYIQMKLDIKKILEEI